MEARVEALDLSGGLTRVLHLVDRPLVSSLTWHMSPPRSLLDICLRERAGRIAAGYWRRLCFVPLKAEVFLFEWALLRAENTDAAYSACSPKKDVSLSFYQLMTVLFSSHALTHSSFRAQKHPCVKAQYIDRQYQIGHVKFDATF